MKYLLTFVLTLIVLSSYSQLSKTHYIPPFYAHDQGDIVAREQILYISTPHASANYTITDGAGVTLQTGTVVNGSFEQYDMDGYGTAFILDNTQLNSTQTNKGLIINADNEIYANLRVNAGNSFAQGGSLTSKGISALGTTYRLGHLPSIEDHARKASCFSVMATQNNTVVTIAFEQNNLICFGPNPPSTSTPLVINLNAGESYTAAIVMEDDANNLGTGFNGSLVSSNLPIAVNTGSWAGSLINNGGADIGIDQIVDLSLVGDKYVCVRGQGAGTNDDDMEQVMVVAHFDSTIIYVNGNTLAIDTIDAGEYRLIDGSSYTNEVMYIETSEPAYLYQFILGGDNTTNTQGMNFVPPITCYTSQEINSIPVIEEIGTQTYSGGISIVTKQGSSILVNGSPPTVPAIPVPGSNYEAYKILSLTGDVVVSTNSIALVGFFGYQGAAGYGGYYSGFDRVEFTSSIIEACPPGVLSTTSNLNGTYQWYKDNVALAGETTDTLNFSSEGEYFIIFSKDECRDTSATINILPIPQGDLGNDFYLCPNNDSLISPVFGEGITVSWFGTNPSSTLTVDSAGTYWAEFINDNGCATNDTMVVTSDELTFTSSIVEECIPGILATSSSLSGSYQWHKDNIALTGETKDSLSFSQHGDYYVVISIGECNDTTSMINIPPPPSAMLGEDFIMCLGNDTSIEAQYNLDFTLAWFARDTADMITIDSAGTYWVEITSNKGCKGRDTLEVSTKDCTHELVMPNVFIPNSSGVNDNFVPVLSKNTLNPSLEIYNRWGELIFITDDLLQGWDGTRNNKPVSTGTYFWVLTYQSENLTQTFNHRLSGYVQLL